MRGARLTKRFVDAAKPRPKGRAYYWDAELRGFGLMVTASGAKSYLFQYSRGHSKPRVTIGTHGEPWTPDTARKEALRLRGLVAAGGDPASTRKTAKAAPTLRSFAKRYLEDHAEPRKKSAAEDARLLKKTILPFLGRKRITEVSRADLVRFHLARRGTPYLANRALALLSKLFALAEAWGERPQGTNPAHGIERFREEKRKRFLDAEELVRIGAALRAAEGEEPLFALAAIRFLLLTGCRLGEVLSLEWAHVDDGRACLRLPDSKTGAKDVPLGVAALDLLAALPKVEGNPYVFPGRLAGRPLVGVPHVWHRIRATAKVSDVRLHDLRHSFAAAAVGGGASLPLVGAILGHSSPTTTARYAHLAATPATAVADSTSRALAAALAGKKIAAVRGSKRAKVVAFAKK